MMKNDQTNPHTHRNWSDRKRVRTISLDSLFAVDKHECSVLSFTLWNQLFMEHGSLDFVIDSVICYWSRPFIGIKSSQTRIKLNMYVGIALDTSARSRRTQTSHSTLFREFYYLNIVIMWIKITKTRRCLQ